MPEYKGAIGRKGDVPVKFSTFLEPNGWSGELNSDDGAVTSLVKEVATEEEVIKRFTEGLGLTDIVRVSP